ncbi:MAG TPA: hypothetical protein VJI52_02775 [Candidatus Nanoarchaeia archaeon]|nr:hypothetical protein [Candidatus Nanoarchaeia archaeon]
MDYKAFAVGDTGPRAGTKLVGLEYVIGRVRLSRFDIQIQSTFSSVGEQNKVGIVARNNGTTYVGEIPFTDLDEAANSLTREAEQAKAKAIQEARKELLPHAELILRAREAYKRVLETALTTRPPIDIFKYLTKQ